MAFDDFLDLTEFLIGFFSGGFYMLHTTFYTLQTLHIFIHDSSGSFCPLLTSFGHSDTLITPELQA